MQIKTLHIKNFKGFKEREFSFSSKFTLLIGDNGSGKTSVLEALSIGLGGFLAGLDGVKSRNIFLEEVRRETEVVGDATVTTELLFPVEIICTAEMDEKTFEWKRSLNSMTGKTTHKYANQIIKYASKLQQMVRLKDNTVILPIVVYMSARRTWSQKKDKWKDPFEKEEISRFLGYTDCLDAESNIKFFVRWLRRMQLIQIQKNKHIGELNAVLRAVRIFLSELLETKDEINILYDFSEEEVMIEMGDESLPLRMMSAGYQSIIGMVADLAYRIALLNPQLKDEAVIKTPGVVLIDEIDLHIHPKWQWKIVNVLKNTFPKVQFIATTHSPIVIASCEENELVYLYEENGEIKDILVENPYGWLIEDVLTGIMGANRRSPKTELQIERIRELYQKKLQGVLSEDEIKELEKLSNLLQELLPEGDPAVTLAKMNAIEAKLFGGNINAQSK